VCSPKRYCHRFPLALSIPLSFEQYESWPAADFLHEVGDFIEYHLTKTLKQKGHQNYPQIEALLQESPPSTYQSFGRFFRRLHQIDPALKIVLIIDEFDATPQDAISLLLQTWRSMYLEPEPPHALHSIILIGIQNIARLNFGRSSPFNIAYQQRLNGFSLEEVQRMMAQYTMLHEQTAGHPYILFGGTYKFNQNSKMVNDLYRQGVICEDEHENCQIANAIYSEVLLAAFRPDQVDYQTTILVNGYDFRSHVVDGQLQMKALLSRFREFVERRGQEAFKVTKMPQEKAAFDKGLTQLAGYLAKEGQEQGYYVIFHARPNVYGKLTYDELEFDETEDEKEIAVYLVRLGL